MLTFKNNTIESYTPVVMVFLQTDRATAVEVAPFPTSAQNLSTPIKSTKIHVSTRDSYGNLDSPE